ncbi:MAG: sporulation protein YunB [Firmicutes bacterium]|nr:sporulation protein YunB [Bacillota bacterium]
MFFFQQNLKSIRRFLREWLFGRGLFPFIVLTLIVFLILKGFFVIERNLRPAILSLAELKANAVAVDAVNMALMDKMAQGIAYHDLIAVRQDDRGKIVMAQINTFAVNRLIADTTLTIQEALKVIEEKPFNLPLGEVLDNYLFAAYGPKIPVRLKPAGRVNTRLQDSLEEAGINQVRHKIYLEVLTEVRVVIPFTSTRVEVQTTVPLTDALYPGSVPDTVINLQTGMFDPAPGE